ncbi:adenylate cyclase [Anopheles sinensis]|uniref:Adenylate cyclase n=1 Tax=Anopheles sinensis TaxID=74873 RepID=A0A084WS26_ANOSI|nr:adenylate cyclase [Anopheles sinensis]
MDICGWALRNGILTVRVRAETNKNSTTSAPGTSETEDKVSHFFSRLPINNPEMKRRPVRGWVEKTSGSLRDPFRQPPEETRLATFHLVVFEQRIRLRRWNRCHRERSSFVFPPVSSVFAALANGSGGWGKGWGGKADAKTIHTPPDASCPGLSLPPGAKVNLSLTGLIFVPFRVRWVVLSVSDGAGWGFYCSNFPKASAPVVRNGY